MVLCHSVIRTRLL